MTVLEENHHSFLIVEHNPMLYEDAEEMVEYMAQALKQTSREATILLYAPALDPLPAEDNRIGRPGVLHLRQAGSGKKRAKVETKMPGNVASILKRWI
jgi:DNA polymerase I